MGGSSKGTDFDDFAMAAADTRLRHAVLIGDEAEAIASSLKEWAPNVRFTILEKSPMTDIVNEASRRAKPGDVVVLSPACASFGMFRDYKDRGDQFIAAVKAKLK